MYCFVKAMNNAGTSAASAGVAGLKVTVPHITGHPLDQVVAVSQSVQFTVVATGNPTPSFPLAGLDEWRWSVDGPHRKLRSTPEPRPRPSRCRRYLAALNGLRYRAVVSDVRGSVTSTSCYASGILAAPTIIMAPANSYVAVGRHRHLPGHGGRHAGAFAAMAVVGEQRHNLDTTLNPDATYRGVRTATLTVSNVLPGYNGAAVPLHRDQRRRQRRRASSRPSSSGPHRPHRRPR